MKKSVALPAYLLLILALAFVGFLAWSAPKLPEQVATHFGFSGNPDGWSQRSAALWLMGGFGLGLPLLIVAISWALPLLPVSSINMPNREYWLASERRDGTYQIIRCQMLWLACLLVCFMAGLHWLTIQANNRIPVRMPTPLFLAILGAFLAGMAVWTVLFWREFKR
jgi:uncharacterized membrane protein